MFRVLFFFFCSRMEEYKAEWQLKEDIFQRKIRNFEERFSKFEGEGNFLETSRFFKSGGENQPKSQEKKVN